MFRPFSRWRDIVKSLLLTGESARTGHRDANRLLADISQMATLNYVEELLQKPRYTAPKRLHGAGFKAFSQFDEDGILEEILRRIGIANHRFIEFGVGNGLENNTLYLLTQGWRGLWIDRQERFADKITDKFEVSIRSGRLTFHQAFIDRENLNTIFQETGFDGEVDVMSIDVDGNDYHLWEAVEVTSPRVVIIEYNAKFRPPVEWVMVYNPNHIFDKSDYSGASLSALTLLGKRKGYSLVGCCLTGANAFFVRDDLVADHFLEPFSAEEHYEPARYHLSWQYRSGMPPSYGPFLGKGGENFD